MYSDGKINAYNALYLENIMVLRWPITTSINITYPISHIYLLHSSSFTSSP